MYIHTLMNIHTTSETYLTRKSECDLLVNNQLYGTVDYIKTIRGTEHTKLYVLKIYSILNYI